MAKPISGWSEEDSNPLANRAKTLAKCGYDSRAPHETPSKHAIRPGVSASLVDSVKVIAGDYNQRIPRARQPIRVANRLCVVLADRTIHTAEALPGARHQSSRACADRQRGLRSSEAGAAVSLIELRRAARAWELGHTYLPMRRGRWPRRTTCWPARMRSPPGRWRSSSAGPLLSWPDCWSERAEYRSAPRRADHPQWRSATPARKDGIAGLRTGITAVRSRSHRRKSGRVAPTRSCRGSS